ncbi:MAG: hypothetical protein J3R72DRAFT_526227 [Linnemannia gamsii]|nr:MAG: hypothetical protein J3R72DRAFT_526227 [Linnemannia gamsii]
MLRSSIFAALVFVQATISAVTALNAGQYTISRQSIEKNDRTIYLAGTERTSVVASHVPITQTDPAVIWQVSTFSSGDTVTYTFQWKATTRFMTYEKQAGDGVFIDTGATQHTFRLKLFDESEGRYRILPPRIDGFSVAVAIPRYLPVGDQYPTRILMTSGTLSVDILHKILRRNVSSIQLATLAIFQARIMLFDTAAATVDPPAGYYQN